jgi:hypothetical protein
MRNPFHSGTSLNKLHDFFSDPGARTSLHPLNIVFLGDSNRVLILVNLLAYDIDEFLGDFRRI